MFWDEVVRHSSHARASLLSGAQPSSWRVFFSVFFRSPSIGLPSCAVTRLNRSRNQIRWAGLQNYPVNHYPNDVPEVRQHFGGHLRGTAEQYEPFVIRLQWGCLGYRCVLPAARSRTSFMSDISALVEPAVSCALRYVARTARKEGPASMGRGSSASSPSHL